MEHTELLDKILGKAEDIKNEFNCKELYAIHIAIAFSEFCATEYIGFSVSDKTAYPNWYEEERLRLIYGKILKNSFYFRVLFKKKLREKTADYYSFDFNYCEKIAALRNNNVLSSDLVLLCVLNELADDYSVIYKETVNDYTIIPLLEYIDENIFDYTAKAVDSVCNKLKEKANIAMLKRDWKPAAKFSEPEDIKKQLLDSVKINCEDNILHITIPGFLRGTDLKLNVYKIKDCYIVNDNASAVKSLSTRIDNNKIRKILNLIWGESNLNNNIIFTKISDAKSILYFIQEVILTANADLYYEYFNVEEAMHHHYIESCCVMESEQQTEAFDLNTFLEALKESIVIYYNEDKGTEICLDAKYCHCSYGIKVLIETLNDGSLRFSDGYKNQKYETGEMLEAFYFNSTNEYDNMYYEIMQKISKPFGMAFDMNSSINFPEYGGFRHNHKNPYMLSTTNNWLNDFYKFLNCAVMISVVSERINFEKLREW